MISIFCLFSKFPQYYELPQMHGHFYDILQVQMLYYLCPVLIVTTCIESCTYRSLNFTTLKTGRRE